MGVAFIKNDAAKFSFFTLIFYLTKELKKGVRKLCLPIQVLICFSTDLQVLPKQH